MGMAASQARYLALSARKTNCEYEGQQINQQRLALSNQSADLFNQMLTMSVPMPPSSSEFTKLQYSWSDGDITSVIEDYYQIATPNEEFNYVVTSYHNEKVYTGQRKFLNDPQIQASKTNNFYDLQNRTFEVHSIMYSADKDYYTLTMVNQLGNEYSTIYAASEQNKNKDVTEQLDYMFRADRIAAEESDMTRFVYNETTDKITYGGKEYSYVDVETDGPGLKSLKRTYGALYDSKKRYYYNSETAQYICKDDVDAVTLNQSGKVTVRKKDEQMYYTDGVHYVSSNTMQQIKVDDPTRNVLSTWIAKNNPIFSDYTAVGNCQLKRLTQKDFEEDITIDAEIKQIITDMGSNDGDELSYQRLKDCFDENGNYISGTLYQFKMSGKMYYTTTADMDASLLSAYSEKAVANNSIDSQQSKLSYYNALYLDTKVTNVKKALMETDGAGRFSTVKFEDDSVVYTLNVETIKDEDAYNDAMNKYYYEKERYDKQVADINSKTEIIQAQDRQLQLKLEQLGTEQTALQTEMEACQKIVSKNIENSFKTFGG